MSSTTGAGVLVVIGSGGMGLAVARRMGSGHRIVLADFSEKQLEDSTKLLREEGQIVEAIQADISSMDSVQNLARQVSSLGPLRAIVLTAGLSPAQSPAKRIYQVNLLGAAQVIEAFYPLATMGTTMVVISSIAGHGKSSEITPGLEQHLATAPSNQLLPRSELDTSGKESKDIQQAYQERMRAYSVSKKANRVRVQAAASAWASKGARINTVSPGVIATTMAWQERDGPVGEVVFHGVISKTPIQRAGSPIEIANTVAFLSSPEASLITGADIIADGGFTASEKWAKASL